MIFSLIRGGLILFLSGFLTYFFVSIENIPGSLNLELNDKEFKVSLLSSVILLIFFGFFFWVSLKLLSFSLAVLDFLMGKDTALLRFFKKIRYRKSQNALNSAIFAMTEGDPERVLLETAKAKLNPDFEKVIYLLEAQAQESLGHKEKADKIYKKLLLHKETKLIAIEGLIRSKVEKGDLKLALKLAEKAVALRPKNLQALNTFFKLQCDFEDWPGARKTLLALQNIEKNTREIRLRQEALLLFSDAKKERSKGNTKIALEKIRESIRKSPGLVPAVCQASELEKIVGKVKNAERLIKACWKIEPHPDLAKSFAALYPDETTSDRLKRFKPIFTNFSNNHVVNLIKAELYLAAEDFPAARRILVKLVDEKPNSQINILMAAVEKGSGSSADIIQGWLSKAFSASRPPVWFCKACNNIGNWEPICLKCGQFDSYEWGLPETNKIFSESDALLPMIIETSVSKKGSNLEEEIILENNPLKDSQGAQNNL